MAFIKEDAKKMADLLRTGHKMLNLSCPICNNPIFQNKEGVSFCAICNRAVIMADSVSDKNIEENETILNKDTKQVNIPIVLITILTDKLNWITQKLEKENQLDIIEKYLKILFDLLNLLEKAKGFK
ncbi:MAG: hypothetical protein CEE42_11410 [Promethearchaeota archaeon Loki_b31]|nr:MAG: hypothetical protein CEE42_11410 [Candidatus Lokiarchaeota archaeon Loki_b31]